MDFVFKHPGTGEHKVISLSDKQIQEKLMSDLELTCGCEPEGEATFTECNCYEYLDEFELQDRL